MGDSRGGLLPQRMLRTPVRPSERVEPLPEPGWVESIGASFRAARDDQPGHADEEIVDAYGPLIEALGQLGHPVSRYVSPGRSGNPINEGNVWADIAAARARDGKLFASLPADADAFRAQTLERARARMDRDAQTVERSGWAPWLIGTLAGGITDPINLGVTLATGGAGVAAAPLRAAGREAIVNGITSAVTQPLVAAERSKTGRDLSLGEAALNVAADAAVGGLLSLGGSAAKGIADKGAPIVGRAGEAVVSSWETGLAAVWDKLPAPVRERWKAAADVSAADLPDIAELTIGRDNMSEAELAAVDVLRREAAVAKANPFVPNGAGVRAHTERLDEALARVLADQPAAPAAGRGTASSVSRGALRSGSSLGTPAVPGVGARAALKQRIAVVESSGGTRWANPRSSARGKYQFLGDTWLAYYKRRFGETGESDAAILAKRADARLQDALMDDLMADNAAFLRRRGEAETAGNLYLVHFAGQGGARRLLDADPDAPVARVLGADVVAANPHLRGMTAADAIAWAHRKMNEPVSPRAGARVELAGGGESEARGLLQAELDRLEAERAELARQADAADAGEPSIAELVEQGAAREGDDVLAALDLEPLPEPLRPFADDPPPVIAPKRGRTLPVRNRPSDLIEFLADRGGIRDDAGHDLRGMWDRNPFVPRAGNLIRPRGMSIDEAGELMSEAGFFHDRAAGEPWTEAEVLDLLDQAVNQNRKLYAAPDLDAVQARDAIAMREEEEGRLSNLALELDIDPVAERDILEDIARRMAEGESAWGAMEAAYTQRVPNVLDRIAQEADDYGYDWIPGLDDWPEPATAPVAAGSGGPAPAAGTAGGSGAAGPDGRAAGSAEGFDPAIAEPQARAFDDPDGDGARAQVESLEHDTRMALVFPPRNTRGAGEFYHGARAEVPQLAEGYYNPANIYGGMDTFYTTDAVDIASGYSRKRAGGRVYRAVEREPVKWFDMEARATPQAWFERFGVGDDDGSLFAMAADELSATGDANLREIMDEMRAMSAGEGITRDEVQELFDALIYQLREQGFGGMTHQGGLKTGRQVHTVRIYFDAPNQLELVDVTPSAYRTIDVETNSKPAGSDAPDPVEPGSAGATEAGRAQEAGELPPGWRTREIGETGKWQVIDGEGFSLGAHDSEAQALDGALGWLREQEAAATAMRERIAKRDEEPDMFGGATASDVRASLERQGEGRAKASVAQKPPGSDGGLFDVQAQDMSFRFDEDGPEVTGRELLDELDAEQADIDALRACLPPDKPASGGAAE